MNKQEIYIFLKEKNIWHEITEHEAVFTMEELLEELMRSSYLFDSVPYFFAWASSRLRTQTAAKKKSTGNAGRNKKS